MVVVVVVVVVVGVVVVVVVVAVRRSCRTQRPRVDTGIEMDSRSQYMELNCAGLVRVTCVVC